MDAPRRVPTRTCVACRTMRPKRELLRVVRNAAGEIAIDASGRMMGRGAYVCNAAACIDGAIAKGVLARALKTSFPPELRAALGAEFTNMTIEGGAHGQK